MNKVSIIILNYNGGSIILDCLESVFQTRECDFEVLVIDNNSKDNSQVIAKEKFPEIRLIQNEDNLGIGARTIGIKEAIGKFAVFLDSDTIVESDWLKKLINSYNEHGPGIYQSKLLDMKDHSIINTAGNMINVLGFGHSRGKGEKDNGQYDKFQNISYTAGACTFSSLEIMQKIGGVDYIFVLYHDDLDFGWRGILQGIPSYLEPKSIVYHLGSPNWQWTKKKFFYLERNRWICLLTLFSRRTLIKILPQLILLEFGLLVYFTFKGLGIAKIKSCFSLFKIRKEMNKRKKDFEKKRKLSDKEVIKYFSDEFHLPPDVATGNSARIFSNIVKSLSKSARKTIE